MLEFSCNANFEYRPVCTFSDNVLWGNDTNAQYFMHLYQGLLNNPEMLRSMMMANPQVRQLMETNPEIGQMMSDPQFLRQVRSPFVISLFRTYHRCFRGLLQCDHLKVMDMARNPELSREMRRNADRAIANLEAIPGGFNHLQRMYNQIQAPLESAFTLVCVVYDFWRGKILSNVQLSNIIIQGTTIGY